LLFMMPEALAGLFLDPGKAANAAPLALAVSYLFITAVFQVFDGTQATMAAALRGLNDTSVPMVIAIVGYWGIGFPTAWLLGFQAGFGGIGIWWGLAAGLAFVAIALVIRFALRERLGLLARATRHG
jgi:MATE family multidrug resistance protein